MSLHIANRCLFLCLFLVIVLGNSVPACDLNWLYIDIHYRNVDARPDTFSYGLFVGAGANSQNQSLWPSISSNETRLATNDFCGPQSPGNCGDAKFSHGHFGADSSKTWRETPQYASLDSESINLGMNTTIGQETLNLFSHYFDPSPATKHAVDDHQITLMSDYRSNKEVFFESGSLGLGPSSTIMKTLVENQIIGRSVVGLYLGTAYPRAGGTQNGSVVLGGYDAGRLDSPAHVYKQVQVPSPGLSPFRVGVKQFSLVTKDGSSIGLVTDGGFEAYISTTQYPMDLPASISKRLAAALGATPAGNSENTMTMANSFDGNISITLEDGFVITYPSEWLFNTSASTPFSASRLGLNQSANDTEPLVFGAAFLHHLYMTIDYDASTFALSQAKMYNNYVQPQPLCSGAVPTAMEVPRINTFTQSGLIGAILGSVIGGIGFLWLLFFVVRKTLQHRKFTDAMSKMEHGGSEVVAPKRSSLRAKTRSTLVRFSTAKDVKVMVPRHAKRVSFTDSESSSIKGIIVSVRSKGSKENKDSFEMNDIEHTESANPNIKPAIWRQPPVAGIQQVTPNTGAQVVQQTAIMQPLPTPNRFVNPYAPSPGPTPLTGNTPQTGNPLLGEYHQVFMSFADDDDSDLPINRRRHERSGSEQLRLDMGLKVDTHLKSHRSCEPPPVEITGSRSTKSKPAPLPLRITGAPRIKKTEADYIKKNPVRALFGLGRGPNNEKHPSNLRRIFPSS